MENYIVSARKYRPATFDTVVGQSSLTTTLKNAIKSGRLAHAYLFCGPRGVGKTTCARIFAKTINCLHPKENGEACDECESCRAFNEQRSYNIHELDAASNNSVDDIRQLIDQVRIPPQVGKYKVFIIDEVHMLSTSAFNAFLKTLEEPPAHAIFILATTEKHKLLPTILSRCQIYDFSRMSVPNIVEHLKHVAQSEGISFEESALNVIARKADGGMRDALSIFDQVASFCGGNITYQRTIENLNVLDSEYYFKLTDYFLGKNIPEIMMTLNEILNKGFDGQHFITGMASHFRNLLVSRDQQTVALIEATDDVRARYAQQAQKCSPKFICRAMKLCNDCDLNYKVSRNKRLLVELTLIEVAQATDDDSSSGRSPEKILKPIFKEVDAVAPQAASVRQTSVVQPAAVSAAHEAAPAPTAATAQGLSAVHRTHIAPSAQPAGNSVRRTLGFSIRQEAANAKMTGGSEKTDTVAGHPAGAVAPQVAMNKPVDANELVVAWREFASRLPQEETAMASRMSGIMPKLIAPEEFEVLASNSIVEEMFNDFKPRILDYMSRRLFNGGLKMTVRVPEVEEQPKVYNRVEQFNIMCQQNPALAKLKDVFELEFG